MCSLGYPSELALASHIADYSLVASQGGYCLGRILPPTLVKSQIDLRIRYCMSRAFQCAIERPNPIPYGKVMANLESVTNIPKKGIWPKSSILMFTKSLITLSFLNQSSRFKNQYLKEDQIQLYLCSINQLSGQS